MILSLIRQRACCRPLRRSSAGLLRICAWPAGSAQIICTAHHDSAWHHATIKALRLQLPSAQALCGSAAHPHVQLAGVRRRSARHMNQRAPQVTIKQRAWAPPLCCGSAAGLLRICPWPAGSAQIICTAHHDSAWHHATIKAALLLPSSAQVCCGSAAGLLRIRAGVLRICAWPTGSSWVSADHLRVAS
jgi:hypothetical protein